MEEIIGRNDNFASVNVTSTMRQFKSFKLSEHSTFANIIMYRFLSEILRNDTFIALVSEQDLIKINNYMFKLRHKPEIVLCQDLGDDKIFIGDMYTGSDSAAMVEVEKLRKIVYEMVDYKPFNYREIFLNTFNYGNRT